MGKYVGITEAYGSRLVYTEIDFVDTPRVLGVSFYLLSTLRMTQLCSEQKIPSLSIAL